MLLLLLSLLGIATSDFLQKSPPKARTPRSSITAMQCLQDGDATGMTSNATCIHKFRTYWHLRWKNCCNREDVPLTGCNMRWLMDSAKSFDNWVRRCNVWTRLTKAFGRAHNSPFIIEARLCRRLPRVKATKRDDFERSCRPKKRRRKIWRESWNKTRGIAESVKTCVVGLLDSENSRLQQQVLQLSRRITLRPYHALLRLEAAKFTCRYLAQWKLWSNVKVGEFGELFDVFNIKTIRKRMIRVSRCSRYLAQKTCEMNWGGKFTPWFQNETLVAIYRPKPPVASVFPKYYTYGGHAIPSVYEKSSYKPSLNDIFHDMVP